MTSSDDTKGTMVGKHIVGKAFQQSLMCNNATKFVINFIFRFHISGMMAFGISVRKHMTYWFLELIVVTLNNYSS